MKKGSKGRHIPTDSDKRTLLADICRIKTGHSNLVSCLGPRMRALAKVFYRGESRGKIPCQRPLLVLKCCAKNCPNYIYWIQGKHCGFWVWVFFNYLCYCNWFLLFLLIFILFLYYFLKFAGEGATGREQPQGRKVTLTGPKSHTRAKMSLWSVMISHDSCLVQIWWFDLQAQGQSCPKISSSFANR